MKKQFYQIMAVTAMLFGCSDSSDKPLSRVDQLIDQMTIEEKVGQMTQISLERISVGEGYKVVSPLKLDKDRLNEVILENHVGSILNCGGEPHTTERWFEIVSEIQEYAMKDRLQIPVLYGIDAIHGTNYTVGATLYPQEVGMAATWNPELMEDLGAITAYETRASSIPWTFSPVLDLGINPEWPRQWEGFGEDPYLGTIMGVAMTKGFEGDDVSNSDRVASCLKHFIGYGAPVSGKDRTPAWIPDRVMREYFLPPFQKAIDAGAKSIMINSGEVNGVPVHASHYLLTEILRDEMGFEGVAVTDWYDIWNLVERHHVAKDRREAVKLAIDAGVDMSMVPLDLDFTEILISLVKDGEISEERIDMSVRRILQMKEDLGLFETPVTDPKDYPKFGSKEHAAVAYDAAAESITLLKNSDAILPLKRGTKVLVTGPNANIMRSLNGGWSYTWQGEKTDSYASEHNTIVEAMKNNFGAKNVQYVAGVDYDNSGSYYEDNIVNLGAVTKAAKSADLILLCIGENSYTEKPGDLNDLSLSANQQELAKVAFATGKPVVVVLNEGRPRIIKEIAESADAVIQTYLPGNYGGDALADIIIGKVNPSGKLPYTYPQYTNSLVPYYHKVSESMAHNDGNDYKDEFFNPQWKFGYGLSYTEFEYSNFIVPETISAGGDLKVKVTVTNRGAVAGKEVVQLFVTDEVASITPNVKRLRAFDKVLLAPNESRDVVLSIPVSDLSFIGLNNKPVLENGEFVVAVDKLKATVILK